MNCIKPDWRYLFKLSRSQEWCPWQFWLEVIAYRLGCLIGVPVPPAHVGLNRNYHQGQNVYGALIEWFYDEREDIYTEGGQYMMQLVENYDRDKGEKHNFTSIMGMDEAVPEFVEHWAGIFLLDSLIGNTDRHQDNWGLIIERAKKKTKDFKIVFAPAFDNGTALEYGIQEDDFIKYRDPNKLKSYLESPRFAKHHMKWFLDDMESLNYYQFLAKFIMSYEKAGPIIKRCLSFSRKQVEEILEPLCGMICDDPCRLTQKRLDFMLDMIFKRKELLEKTLKKCNL